MDFDRVDLLLRYDPAIGQVFWRRSGKEAGCIGSHGYRQIQVDGKLYLAHRLAWLLVTGSWPANQIDHINGVRSDNALSNLRDVSISENIINQEPRVGHSCLGIHRRKDSGKWMAHIARAGRVFYLGQFETEEQAATARLAAQRHLYPDREYPRSYKPTSTGETKCQEARNEPMTAKSSPTRPRPTASTPSS